MKTLLFTGGGGAGSEALYRLLGLRYRVHFADADPEARPFGVPPAAWHAIPLAAAADFVSELRVLCRQLDVDVLAPGVDEELLPVAHAPSPLAAAVLLPPAEFVAAHLDKLRSHALLESLGVPVPRTEPAGERRLIAFPCIVKPRRGRGSRHVAVVSSEEELRSHVVMSRQAMDDFLVQERLAGQEFTVTMVADRRAALRAVVPVKVGLKRGITLRAATDRDEAVMAACANIHAGNPVSGCFNIQLIKTATGEVRPFEINPRISTTTCLALAAGVNFVDLFLEAAPPGAGGLAPFQDGLCLRRSWHNEFLAPGFAGETTC